MWGSFVFLCQHREGSGIPAFGLSGVTDSGGHAWAAVKLDPDEWSTGVGRIGGVSQGKGGDPQTGQSISEQEVWMWSSRDYRSRSLQVKVGRHFWLADFLESQKRSEDYAKAVRDIELAFKRVVDTGSTDWFRAETEVGLHRRICEMYRQVGEVKLAENIEKRLDRQMEKAKLDAL